MGVSNLFRLPQNASFDELIPIGVDELIPIGVDELIPMDVSDLFSRPCFRVIPGPWQCALFLIPRSFHDGGALNYSTAPHRSKTTLISNGAFCLLESKILSIGQTLLYSLGSYNPIRTTENT
jgi:hypothetical protein